jgi:FAS-associated factor 2
MSSPELDISQLNEVQQTALQTYTSVTDQEPLAAIPVLQRAEWNVQIAIARFFDGEPASDPLAEARTALPSASARQATNLLHESILAASRPTSPRRPATDTIDRIAINSHDEVQYRPPFLLSVLFTPLHIVYRLFSTILSRFSFLVPSFVYRIFARLTSSYRSRPSRRPLPPADNARRFIREFSEEYGANDLPFAENGFNLSLDTAKRDLKFLLVILISPNHDDTSSWVRETLLSNEFGQFLTSHKAEIHLWGGNVQDAEAYQVSDSLGCTKFPFAALLCHTTETGSTGMSVVMRSVGPTTASELIAKLGTAMTAHESQLAATRAQRREQQASRNLRQEQDSAYQRSLAQDRERSRRKREEADAQARAEKEALSRAEAEEKRKTQLQQWRRWRAQSLPPEPEAKSKDTVRISIRLAGGERVIRKFQADADLEELYAFVECFEFLPILEVTEKMAEEPAGFDHVYKFRLVSPMPRTVYDLEEGGSIGDRVGNGANLIVEPISREDDSEQEA